MAGFMTFLAPVLFCDYERRVLNIHPSLLPAFPGARAVRDALAAGVTHTGTTIHIATPTLDDPRFIVAQREVRVLPGDTEETLHERIKEQERLLYPEVVRDVLNGKLNLELVEERS
jgi:phosphoribosylglycinamide formyltransferase-1